MGGGGSQEKMLSGETRKLIDTKVREILATAYETAKRIIRENFDLHKNIAEVLLEKEEMLKEEFDEYFVGMENVPEKILK